MFFLRWVPFKETLPQLGNGRFCLNDWHAVVPRRLAPAYWLRWQLLRDGCGDLRCDLCLSKRFPKRDLLFPPKSSLPLGSSIFKTTTWTGTFVSLFSFILSPNVAVSASRPIRTLPWTPHIEPGELLAGVLHVSLGSGSFSVQEGKKYLGVMWY